MGILENHQYGVTLRVPGDAVPKRFKGALFSRGGITRHRPASGWCRQGQQLSDQGHVIRWRCQRQRRLKLAELVSLAIVACKPTRVLYVLDCRMEGAICVVRRAIEAQTRVWLLGDASAQRRCEARLADARLARKQHDRALAGARLRPVPQ